MVCTVGVNHTFALIVEQLGELEVRVIVKVEFQRQAGKERSVPLQSHVGVEIVMVDFIVARIIDCVENRPARRIGFVTHVIFVTFVSHCFRQVGEHTNHLRTDVAVCVGIS